jgi:hypothetical protein
MSGLSRASGRRFPIVAALALVAGVLPTAAHSLERVRLQFAQAQGDGWTARGIEVVLTLGAPGLQVRIDEARVPGVAPLRGLRIDCPALLTTGGRYRCREAVVTGSLGPLGAQRIRTAFEYHSGTGALRLDARDLQVAGGAAELAAALDDAGWRARARATGVDLAAAAQLARPWAPLPDGFALAGRTDVAVEATGAGTHVRDGRADVTLAEVTLASADGTLATDRLGAVLVTTFGSTPAGLRFDAQLRTTTGQGYVDPVFVDFATLPLEAEARGTLASSGTLHLGHYAARQPDALAVVGTAEIDPAAAMPLRAARVDVQAVTFPGAGVYVAPFLATTDFRNATASGTLTGAVTLRDGLPREVDLAFDGLAVDDPDGALAFSGLGGRLRWYDEETRTVVATADDRADDAFVSTLRWQEGRLYGISLGATALKLTASGRSFRLLEPAFVPVLDGGLRIDRLRMRHIGEPEMWLRFDARVEPISLALISKALDWPEFGGTISGTIPSAALDDGVLTFGGNLEAQVFGGRVTVGGLRLEDPLGRFPRLLANVQVDDLDLQQVTGTFSFGEITGRLSGAVENLELFGWQPVRFDAHLATPPGDRSRRRISQRAVENLSSIGGGGGGVTAALQSGVLRFFETFRYDRLGISCRLENDVCRMSGVGPAKNGGYYIVRGSGLPRIDIIGNGDRVAWSRLVEQLVAATESGGVEVR